VSAADNPRAFDTRLPLAEDVPLELLDNQALFVHRWHSLIRLLYRETDETPPM
jgi:hypothetical protein